MAERAARIIWCAGFFDGEGCISLQWSNGGWHHQVLVSQRDTTPLLLFQELFGGRIVVNNTNAHMLYFRRLEAPVLLEALLDYLVVKKPQAVLMLEFFDLCTSKVGVRWSKTERERISEIHDELRRLKRPWKN